MEIPLSNRLKKRAHLEVAMLQDEVMEVIYAAFPELEPVLHGGTAIWRCYSGNRFSEDLDFYAKVGRSFNETWSKEILKRNLIVSKYKESEGTIFSKVSNREVEIRVEISKRMPKRKIVAQYEKANGTKMGIYALSPADLIEEKMNAYKSRKLIRDIYDVYHLSNIVEEVPQMEKFLESLPEPIDEKNLRSIIYSGISPSFKEMVEILQARV